MDAKILEACKRFAGGLADNDAYMMEMVDAIPLMDAKENNLFIIDIRPEAVYQAGHIGGSVNYPLALLAQRADTIPTDREVLVVCTVDSMSAYATMTLRLLGFSASLVKGGVPAYAEAGGTLEVS